MDTTQRLIAKATCWQVMGLISMTLIGYAFTGSFGEGGLLAVISTVLGFATYMLHERLWAKIRWGRR